MVAPKRKENLFRLKVESIIFIIIIISERIDLFALKTKRHQKQQPARTKIVNDENVAEAEKNIYKSERTKKKEEQNKNEWEKTANNAQPIAKINIETQK